MPKSSEKTLSVLLRFPGKTIRADLFPAELWPDRGGANGLFRLRIGGKWHMADGRKYSFAAFGACMALVGRIAAEAAGMEAADTPAPTLPKGSRVRVPSRVLAGVQLYDKAVTLTPPIQGLDGRWRVFVIGRVEPVAVEDLR